MTASHSNLPSGTLGGGGPLGAAYVAIMIDRGFLSRGF